MIVLYVILGILAYLVVGTIATAFAIRFFPVEETGAETVVLLWPILLIVICIIGPPCLCGAIARRLSKVGARE